MYDALTEREAELYIQYPHLLKRLEVESNLGSKVSRFGGRVGPIISIEGDDGHDDKVEDVSLKEMTVKTTTTRMTEKKLRHLENAPMQSLDNAMMAAQVVKWLNRVRKGLFESAPAPMTITSSRQRVMEF